MRPARRHAALPTPRRRRLTALEDVSLDSRTIARSSAIVGPSGAGKTTLLELVCGLQQPDLGELVAPPAALMPQRDLLLPWLDAARQRRRSHSAWPGAHAPPPAARRLPCSTSSGSPASTRPARTSSRGACASASPSPERCSPAGPLLCLDEPFGALDAITRIELQDWLAEALAREPRTVLLVTHDVEEAIVLADRLLVLSRRPGRIAAEFQIDTPRPRSRADPGVVELRARVLEALR